MPAEKKNCPVCGKKAVSAKEGEVTTCPQCGHTFRPSD